MSDKKDLAYQDYLKGMKYKEIAEKHGVTLNTVKSWKTRYKWSRDGVHTKQKSVHTKKGGQPGNKNAVGNRGGSAPPKNTNAVTHGFFQKFLPSETLEIMESMQERSAADLIYDQIQIQYAAIIRAQQIMFVTDKDEMIKELKKRKEDSGENYETLEEEYEFQFSWDRHATFLNAQSRAMGELRNLIKQFNDMAHEDDERRLKLEQMKTSIDKAKHEMTMKQKELDLKEKELAKKNAPPEKPDIDSYIEALKGRASEVWNDEE